MSLEAFPKISCLKCFREAFAHNIGSELLKVPLGWLGVAVGRLAPFSTVQFLRWFVRAPFGLRPLLEPSTVSSQAIGDQSHRCFMSVSNVLPVFVVGPL